MNKILLCFAFIVFPHFLLPLNQYNKTGKKVVKNSVMFGQYTLYQVFIFETIRREDYRAKPYRCPAGYLTCGIGCVIDSPKEKRFLNGITYGEAKREVSQQFDDI